MTVPGYAEGTDDGIAGMNATVRPDVSTIRFVCCECSIDVMLVGNFKLVTVAVCANPTTCRIVQIDA